jgi:hypothetical protein
MFEKLENLKLRENFIKNTPRGDSLRLFPQTPKEKIVLAEVNKNKDWLGLG